MAQSSKNLSASEIELLRTAWNEREHDGGIERLITQGNTDLQDFMHLVQPSRHRLLYISSSLCVKPESVDELLNLVAKEAAVGARAICVVENISPSLVARLGHKWQINPAFWASHVSNPAENSLWRPLRWGDKSSPLQSSQGGFERMTGIYEFYGMDIDLEAMRTSSANNCRRICFQTGDWPANYTTNVSYLRVSENLYLFLVDPPVPYLGALRKKTPQQRAPSLRFPYSLSNGGLLFPSTNLDAPLNLFEALEWTFKHHWTLSRLFQQSGVFPKVALAYLLSTSLWNDKVVELDGRIKGVSFNEVQVASNDTTAILHRLREELAHVPKAVNDIIFYTHVDIDNYFQMLWESEPFPKPSTSTALHGDVLIRANDLNRFLLETFQLLTNTIAIRDSQLSIQLSYQGLDQTDQGILLTRLATVYLPLSLATGLFGMNVYQLNESGPPVWAFVVTCVAISMVTWLLLLASQRQLNNRHVLTRSTSRPRC